VDEIDTCIVVYEILLGRLKVLYGLDLQNEMKYMSMVKTVFVFF